MASISTTGRGDAVPRPGGGKPGIHVGTMSGIQWVSWNGKREFENMCATFDQEAASRLMREKTSQAARRRLLRNESEIDKIDRRWPRLK